MHNIKLTLEYDGTHFCGWQWQPNGRTVQGVLEEAIEKLFKQKLKTVAAGRTDSGVHALGQVVNFKTKSLLELNSILKGLNSYLPEDVVVLKAEEVDGNFHARFDAKKRKYKYVISKRPRAVGRQFSWYCRFDLELSKIKNASTYLVGEHVFSAFSKEIENESHYLSRVESIEWMETTEQIILNICANRFLHNMVRIIVGTMVEVGRGFLKPEEVIRILESKNREKAGPTVPAQGLFLLEICY